MGLGPFRHVTSAWVGAVPGRSGKSRTLVTGQLSSASAWSQGAVRKHVTQGAVSCHHHLLQWKNLSDLQLQWTSNKMSSLNVSSSERDHPSDSLLIPCLTLPPRPRVGDTSSVFCCVIIIDVEQLVCLKQIITLVSSR